MFDGETNFQYNEYSISDILTEQAPAPPKFSTHNDFTVYVMGPYTAFNAEVAYDDANKLRTPFQNDPLFDPDRHITNDDKGDMEQALRDFCTDLRENLNCRAFIATDIDIPTHEQAEKQNEARSDDEPVVKGWTRSLNQSRSLPTATPSYSCSHEVVSQPVSVLKPAVSSVNSTSVGESCTHAQARSANRSLYR